MNSKLINQYVNKVAFFLSPKNKLEILTVYFKERINKICNYDLDMLYDLQDFLDKIDKNEYIINHIKSLTENLNKILTNQQKYIILYRSFCLSTCYPEIEKKILLLCYWFGYNEDTYNYILNNVRNTFNVCDIDQTNSVFIFYKLPEKYDEIIVKYSFNFTLFLKSQKIYFKKLKTTDYEHSLDRDSLESLKKLDTLVNIVTEPHFDFLFKAQLITLTGDSILVNEDNFPDLYQLFLKCCKILEIHNIPQLFITQGMINAETCGNKDKYYITIHSGCINLLSIDELMFVIGHELGHIKSNHTYYQFIANYYADLSSVIPYLGNFSNVLIYKWSRMAEFTADRAGLLCCQNVNAVITSFIKMSGIPFKFYRHINIDSYLKQAKEFKENFNKDLIDDAAKFLLTLDQSHPWLVLRASYIKEWADSPAYYSLIHKNEKKLQSNESMFILENKI